MRLLVELGSSRQRIFLVVNKQDLVSEAETLEVQNHIRAQMRGIPNEQAVEIFSLSAHDAMEANRAGDQGRLSRTGLPQFMERLISFLIDEKQAEFLRRTCQRVRDRLAGLDDTAAELERLAALEERIFACSDDDRDAAGPARIGGRVIPRFGLCEVCARVERTTRSFLQKYQYDITVSRSAREELAKAGGLCPFHTWQYAALASPHGTCIGFPDTVDRQARLLETLASGADARPPALAALLPSPDGCILCRVRANAERHAVSDVGRLVVKAAAADTPVFPDICLPHLPHVAAVIPDPGSIRALIAAEAESLERISEDMRRYALKRDGTRRAFTTHDELDAHLRGLVALAGHAYLNFT
jgi:hypothetical protein